MAKEDIIFAIGFATIILLLLLCFLLFFFIKYRARRNAQIRENSEMEKRFEEALLTSQLEVQEATYSVLAKELHDNVGQLLSSGKMLLVIAQRQLKQPPETLSIVEETISKAIVELRSLSKSLDKEWLEQFDIIENLLAEIGRIESGGILKISFEGVETVPFNSEKQIILFRIMQEALQNIIRHAEAATIQIRMEITGEKLHIKIADDGKGFVGETNGGLGISNMKFRTRLLGGEIRWDTTEKGSEVSIVLPFNENL